MISPKLQKAVAHHRDGNLAAAEALYREILAADKGNADAWHLLGVVANQCGNYAAALACAQRAVGLKPDNAEFRISFGEALRHAGRLDEAIDSFARAADLEPESVYPWYNLAVVLALAGRKADAIETYKVALECIPALAEVRNNLAVLLYEAGDAAAAIPHYRAALALLPTHAAAYQNLGLALWQTEAHEDAVAAFLKAAELQPDFLAAHTSAAAGLRHLGQAREAADAYGRAAALDPGASATQREFGMYLLEAGDKVQALAACRRAVDLAGGGADAGEAQHALAVVLGRSGEPDAAVEAYEKAVALRPDKQDWRFELGAIRGEAIRQAPDVFVKDLFDAYAWKFEKHLVEDLAYRVPEELLADTRACAQQDAALRQPPWDILDLGCGTGRCGELFRSDARSIAGVDLAPKMIAAARRRGAYTSLEEGPLLPALQRRHAALDLILAADVFIYVGAMEEVFAAAQLALRQGGLLAFSLEHYDGEGYKLQRHYRFAHAPQYIRQLAAHEGFREKVFRRAALRADVPAGWIVVLAKG